MGELHALQLKPSGTIAASVVSLSHGFKTVPLGTHEDLHRIPPFDGHSKRVVRN